MSLKLSMPLLAQIHHLGEEAYPEEEAGFLLGVDGQLRTIRAVVAIGNAREAASRGNRYLIRAEDYMLAEREAEGAGLQVLGVFHSHPDHPNEPSEFDREWAQPHFSYVITSVALGKAQASRSWRLTEDRRGFLEEEIQVD